MAKNNRYTRRRDHPLRVIENHLRRKSDRQGTQRSQPLDEKVSPLRLDGFDPVSQTGVISINLNSRDNIYQSGLLHQGGLSTNLGTFNAAGFEHGGVDEGANYRVDANSEGLHISGNSQVMLNDNGTFSVWLRGFGETPVASGEDYEYVLSVHQLSDDATPVDEESLVIRWEYDDEATPNSVLRLYPDLANRPGDYAEIQLDEADWQDTESWHHLTATWSYETQTWTLTWDDESDTLQNPVALSWPQWDEFTKVEIFTDLNFVNVVYHDCQFIKFGQYIPATSLAPETTVDLDDAYNNSPSGNKTITVDDGPVTLKTADVMAFQIDSDTTISGDTTLDDKVEWNIVILSDDPGNGNTRLITDTMWNVDHQTSFAGITSTGGGLDTFTFLDFDYLIYGGDGAGVTQVLFKIFDVDVSSLPTGLHPTPTFGPSSSFIDFKVDSNTKFKIDGDGTVNVVEKIRHIGDTDTHILFSPDQIAFTAGGMDILKLIEAGQDEVVVNDSSADIDFRAESLNLIKMFFIDASVDTAGFDIAAPDTSVVVHIGGAGGQGIGFRNDHPPRCRVYRNGNIALATGTFYTVLLNAETYDTDAIHDNAVNSSRITPGVTGNYCIKAKTTFAASLSGSRYMCDILINGALYDRFSDDGNGGVVSVGGSCDADLSSTDFVEMRAWHNSGVNKNIVGNAYSTNLTIHRNS